MVATFPIPGFVSVVGFAVLLFAGDGVKNVPKRDRTADLLNAILKILCKMHAYMQEWREIYKLHRIKIQNFVQ